MNRRMLVAAVVFVASLSASTTTFAAPTAVRVPMHAMFSKTKLVSFTLRNDSGAPLKLKAGDTVMTIDAGKTLALKLPAGTNVTTEEATANHAVGSVIAQVSSDLSGATIAVK